LSQTLVGQRLFAIAPGYEDFSDHDKLRHDTVMAVLAGKLKARRKRCAPVAGKSWPGTMWWSLASERAGFEYPVFTQYF
jgi:hypothetical protein